MKIFTLMITAIQLVLAASARAETPDFPYAYLNAGIPLCQGVVPKVLKVIHVGATRSGGCCGTDEIWTQGQPAPFGFGTRLIDFRAQIDGQLRGYKFNNHRLDQSFASRVDGSVSLMEQIALRNAQISVCMSKVNLASVNQSKAKGTEVLFDLGFKVSVTFDSVDGRKTLFVQELGGQTLATSKFYQLYYDYSPRSAGFIANSWPVIQNHFDFLAPVANAEADQNLAVLKAELGDIFR